MEREGEGMSEESLPSHRQVGYVSCVFFSRLSPPAERLTTLVKAFRGGE